VFDDLISTEGKYVKKHSCKITISADEPT